MSSSAQQATGAVRRQRSEQKMLVPLDSRHRVLIGVGDRLHARVDRKLRGLLKLLAELRQKPSATPQLIAAAERATQPLIGRLRRIRARIEEVARRRAREELPRLARRLWCGWDVQDGRLLPLGDLAGLPPLVCLKRGEREVFAVAGEPGAPGTTVIDGVSVSRWWSSLAEAERSYRYHVASKRLSGPTATLGEGQNAGNDAPAHKPPQRFSERRQGAGHPPSPQLFAVGAQSG